jgi:PAS domain S-box-containing protein
LPFLPFRSAASASDPPAVSIMKPNTPASLAAPERSAALRRTGLLDTPPDESFDRLARLACRLLHAPVALISLVDEHRQFLKSCIGLPEPWASRRETPLSHSFCRHAVESASPLVVDDARQHPLVRGNPAIEELGVAAYAGIPLFGENGEVLGTFCVIDRQPRHWTEEQVAVLTDLAASVQSEIRLREAAGDAARREAESSEMRRQYEELVEGVDAILWESDTVNGFTFVSRHAEAMLGYPVERWLEEPRFWSDELLHPDDRQQALDFCFSSTAEGRDHDFEYRAIRADGEAVWVRELVRVEPAVDGEPTRLRGLIVDITEEKRAEQALQKREAQLAEAQTLARLGSWEIDVKTNELTWSDESFRLFGIEPRSVTPTTEWFFGRVHPEDRERVARAIEHTAGSLEPYSLEARVLLPDGAVRHVQMRGEAVADERGRAVRLRGTGQDVTERVHAEEALRASEESYRTLFDLAGDALFVHDPETGAVLDANLHACQIYGCSLDDLRERGLDIIGQASAPFSRERAMEYIRLAAAGEAQRFEWLVNGASGEPVWAEVSLNRISILGRNRVIANLRDIGERKRAEEAIRDAERHAQATARRMTAVAGAAAGVIGAESPAALLEVLREACAEVVSFDAFSLGIYDAEQHALHFPGVHDAGVFVPAATFPLAGTPSEGVIRERRPLVTLHADAPEANGSYVVGTGRRSESIIRTPILNGERVFGVLMVQSYTPGLYTPEDVEVLEAIASLAATALLNLELLDELRESEESYRTVFEASGDAIYVLDRETGAILDVNRAACELNGYPPEEMKARGIGGLSYPDGPYTGEYAGEVIRRAAAGELQRLEWLARHSSGRDVWGEVTLQRVSILGEERILATARDITGRKAAEEARLQAERDAQAMAARMRAVAGAAAGVIGAESVDALQHVLREECGGVVTFDAFTLALYEPAEHVLHYLQGYDADLWVPAATVSAAGTPAERVIRERRSLVTLSSGDLAGAGAQPMGTGRRSESIIRTPIVSGERVLGILSVQSYTAGLYDEQDVEVLEAVASLAATALLNLELLDEREAAEEALRRINEELEQHVAQRTTELAGRTSELEGVFRALPDLFFRLSPEGSLLPHRTPLDERLYLAPPQFVGRSLAELLSLFQEKEEDRVRLHEAITRTARTGELVSVEYPLHENGETRQYEARLVRLDDGSMIAVARDITDRVAAEEELKRREEHFRRLTENAHDMVAVTTAEGRIRYVSPSAERILGYTPEEMLGMTAADLVHPDDLAAAARNMAEVVANPGVLQTSLIRHRHKNGSWRVLEVLGRTLSSTIAEEGIVVNSRDVTDRVAAEEELKKREEHFRRLIENSHDLVVVVDETNTVRYTSPSAERILGYTPAEWLGQPGGMITHPDDLEMGLARLAEVTAHPGTTVTAEFRVQHKDGSWRTMEVYSRTLDPTSVADGIVVNARDITERKLFEEALQERETRFRRLTENSSDLVQIIYPDSRMGYTGPSVVHLLGYTPEEVAGLSNMDFIHPDDHQAVSETIRTIFSSPGTSHSVRYRVRHKDGRWRVFEAIGRTVLPDSAAEGLVCNARDVTDRHEAEEAMRQSEARYRSLIENAHDIVTILDVEGIVLYQSPQIEAELGYTPEEMLGRNAFDFVHPDDLAVPAEAWQRVLESPNATFRSLHRFRHKDGSWRYIEATGRTLVPGSLEHGLVFNTRDVTAQREAEQALRDSEEHFRRLTENAHDLVAVSDLDGRLRYVSPSVERILGYSPDEMLRIETAEITHPDDLATIADAYARHAAEPGAVNRSLLRLRHRDGGWRMLESISRRLSPDRVEDGIVVNARDITERVEAERALQEREEWFRSLIENAHDLVMVIDSDAGIRYVSPSVERILGFSQKELIGTPGFDLVHPDDIAHGRQNLGRTVEAPGTVTVTEVRLRHRDGGYRLVESVARTLSSDATDAGIVINVRDITEHRHFEQALRDSEEHFRRLIENAYDMVLVMDTTGAITYASPSAQRVLEALRDSEARYRSLIENAHDIVTLLDLEGHITYQSPQVQSVLGYDPSEMIGENVFDFVHPDDIAEPRAAWEKIREAPSTTFTSEHRFRHRNGSWRYLEAFGRLLVPNAPEQGLVLNTRDVTDRREAEAVLQEREEHFRQLIETSHDLVQTLDQQGRIVYTGPSVERLLGYTPEEITGSGAPEFIHPDDQPRVKGEIIRALSNPGEIIQVEYRVLHKNGGWRWFEAIGRTLSPDTAEKGMVANARDITERREAEQALQEREEHFRRLIENSGDMVQLLDSTGRIIYTGPSVLRLLGYTPEEIEGTEALSYIHPDDLEKTSAALQTMLGSPDEVLTAEYRVLHKEGHYRLFEAFASSLITPDGGRCVVVNARDVTERRLAEDGLATAKQEAEHARETAERANRAKSEFLSRMSHELRTPMNSILGFAQLLDRAPLAQEQKKGVGYILKAGRHLLQLINEVLEIARIEAGRSSFSLEPVRLGTALQEAVALVRPLAAQWRVDLDDGPWPGGDVFVQADRQRLTQVLLNVLANAIKYNRPGGRVQVSCDRIADGDTETIAIRVRDTGRGIAEEQRDQLFTPFSRLGAEQSEVEGTGLGLALSQRLTEAMGGSLTLESTGSEGSVFRIELQITSDPLNRLEAPAEPQPPKEEAAHGPATLLYIEDNLANLNLVETILLCRPRWRTMPALQGLVGLDLAREHSPDLILLDLHLPDIMGEEVLRRLRADPRTAAIPVVVITADATRSTVERLRNAGADAYLTKPLDIDEFLETVETTTSRCSS